MKIYTVVKLTRDHRGSIYAVDVVEAWETESEAKLSAGGSGFVGAGGQTDVRRNRK